MGLQFPLFLSLVEIGERRPLRKGERQSGYRSVSFSACSQFTLYGDCRKGNRPSFTNAARPETAIPLYEAFIARCRESGLPVETGEFGADMKVDLLNDGPVTLWMDTKDMRH